MTSIEALKERIRSRDFKVGVIGLGYVGLPLLLRFGEVGFPVIGFDIDESKVKNLSLGRSYIHHITSERIGALRESGRLEATADFARLPQADALIICVPTPLTRNREPDLQFVKDTAAMVAGTLRPGQIISLESTTYPGTTEEILLPRFVAGGLKVGRDFFLAYSPEREDPGNSSFSTTTIPKVVGGVTPQCLDLARFLYAQAVERVVPLSSTRVAEATKLLENIYRAVNVALVNELKVTFDRMGVDVWEVIEAAKTKPFGFQAFSPGPGLGGHCIPIDPFYLTWKAREFGVTTRFIELAGEVNSAMPAYVVQKISDALNDLGRAIKDSRILVLGVSYKRDVGDLRESPSLEIIELLLGKGARVDYSDPFFARLPKMRHHHLELESVPLTSESVSGYDAAVLATDHSSFPYELLMRSARLIIDTRNAFGARGIHGPTLVRA